MTVDTLSPAELVVDLFRLVDQSLSAFGTISVERKRELVGLVDHFISEPSADIVIERIMFLWGAGYCRLSEEERMARSYRCTVEMPDGELVLPTLDSTQWPSPVGDAVEGIRSAFRAVFERIEEFYIVNDETFLPLMKVTFDGESDVDKLRRRVVKHAFGYIPESSLQE